MGATIKDIARKLNISTSTVSYALNGGPRTVPVDVRDRVLAVARELDYRPNRLARSLITRRAHAIGVVPYRNSRNIILGPFVHLAVNGVLNACEERGYDLMLFGTCDLEQPLDVVDKVIDGRVDAVVFVASGNAEGVARHLAEREFPMAVISSYAPSARIQVQIDNIRGMQLGLDHLFELGHTKIAFLQGMEDHRDAIEREHAFRTWMQEHDLPVRPEWVRCGRFLRDAGEEATRAILSLPDRPTALFCANDEMAFGALVAAREMGVVVPRDLSVIGFDDAPISENTSPALTTLRQPTIQMAEAATFALIDHLDGGDCNHPSSFEPELVVRETTSRPTEDPTHS